MSDNKPSIWKILAGSSLVTVFLGTAQAMDSGLTAAPEQTDAFTTMEKPTKGGRVKSITLSATQDSHFMPGTSDRKGDFKGTETNVLLDNGLFFGGSLMLQTPQVGRDKKLHDTAMIKGTIGYDAKDWAVYGTAGLANGKLANDIVYGFIGTVWEHRGHYRQSPTADQTILLGVQGRKEFQWMDIPVGEAGLTLHSTVYGEASTYRVNAGVATFLTLHNAESDDIRHSVPGLPKVTANGTDLYLGVAFEGVAYDLATDKVGTKAFQHKILAGADWTFKDHHTLFTQVSASSPEVTGSDTRPVALIQFGYKYAFK